MTCCRPALPGRKIRMPWLHGHLVTSATTASGSSGARSHPRARGDQNAQLWTTVQPTLLPTERLPKPKLPGKFQDAVPRRNWKVACVAGRVTPLHVRDVSQVLPGLDGKPVTLMVVVGFGVPQVTASNKEPT